MTDKKTYEEIEYFEQGISLVVANLTFAIDEINGASDHSIEELERLNQEFEVVEDFEEYFDLTKELDRYNEKHNQKVIDENDFGLYLLLNEPEFINKHVTNLLTGTNFQNIPKKELEIYLKDNIQVVLKKILDYPNVNKILENHSIEILKILLNEKNFNDFTEGFNLVLLSCMKHFKKIVGEELDIFRLLIEIDALSSFVFMLNEEEDLLEEE